MKCLTGDGVMALIVVDHIDHLFCKALIVRGDSLAGQIVKLGDYTVRLPSEGGYHSNIELEVIE